MKNIIKIALTILTGVLSLQLNAASKLISPALTIQNPAINNSTIKTSPFINSPVINSNIKIALKPEITGYGHSGCIKKNSWLTILGKHFGSRQGVSLGGHGINVDLPVSSWSDSRIMVRIPDDSRISGGQWYYTGIKNVDNKNWLSNISKNITICKESITIGKTPVTSVSTINAIIDPVIKGSILRSPTSPSDTTRPESGSADNETEVIPSEVREFQQGGSFSEGEEFDKTMNSGSGSSNSAALPSSYGSLIDRSLPEPPSVQRIVEKSFIEKHTEPGELIVLSNNIDEARLLSQQLSAYGLSTKRRKNLKNLGLVISTFRLPADTDLQSAALEVRQAYPNMWVDMNHRYRLLGANRNMKSAKSLINWRSAGKNCSSQGLRIGLIDTDVNKDHPALVDANIKSYSAVSHGITKPESQHATAIAGLLVGKTRSFSGMLPSASLYSASVFRKSGKGRVDTTAEWIISGIDWLLSQKVQVINMSIGGLRNLLVEIALKRSIQSGVAVIAAAGNGGKKAVPIYPAAQPGVIAVTAIDHDLKNYRKANWGDYIDFAAPGVDIWSANSKGSGKFFSGTSYAVPFVTASYVQLSKQLGPVKAYQWLQEHAKDLGEKGKDRQYGWGLVQNPTDCQ